MVRGSCQPVTGIAQRIEPLVTGRSTSGRDVLPTQIQLSLVIPKLSGFHEQLERLHRIPWPENAA